MSEKATETQSVMDSFVASIMGHKAEAAAGLTPVPGERPLERTPAEFPWDGAREQLLASVRIIRNELGYMSDGLAKIEAALEAEPPKASALHEDIKQREAEADARHVARTAAVEEAPDFATRFAAQTAAAQAATFGWACPTHGAKAILDKVSPKGRKFRACTLCREFEY